ncbi:hypothetical protein EVA_02452 [gut metagenome]|uniref:RNA polymerase ECF-type sigma factor n=1 Tax=gut metagenome TaxID=749906 RepID=J9D9B5_9ZZZZ
MKKEEWLKQMKEQLADYSESAPPAVWERLEKDLAASSTPSTARKVPFYRRWELVAAVCLLAVSLAGLWVLQISLPEEITSSSAYVLPIASSTDDVVGGTSYRLSDSETTSVVKSSPSSLQVSSDLALTLVAKQVISVEADGSVTEKVAEAFVKTVAETAAAENVETAFQTADTLLVANTSAEKAGDVSRERYRPSRTDKYHLPVRGQDGTQQRKWSLALALGNTGGFARQTTGGSGFFMQPTSVVSAAGRLDLSATSSGMLAIPEDQQVEFREGIPYLMSSSRVVESVKHKQPVSLGVFVRKMLPKGFSLEIGLNYTYLASDIVFSGHAEKFSQKLHYLGIPLRANWNFWQHNRFELYVSTGGAVEKCIYGKMGSEELTVKPLQLSVMGAVGGQFNFSRRVGLYVEPGVSYFFDDGSEVQTIRKENPCNFTLQGGIRLTY